MQKQSFPALGQAFTYLHDNYETYYPGGWANAIEVFAGEEPEMLMPTVVELDGLLTEQMSDDELSQLLTELGCFYFPASPRQWLTTLRSTLIFHRHKRNHEENFFVNVSFHLIGAELEPDEIERLLGLRGEYAFKRGELIILEDGRELPPSKNGAWRITTDDHLSDRTELVEHITWVLDLLEPVHEELFDLQQTQGIRASLLCVCFMEDYSAFSVLPATVMRRLAKFGIDLYLNICAPTPE